LFYFDVWLNAKRRKRFPPPACLGFALKFFERADGGASNFCYG